MVQWLSSEDMDTGTQVQILDQTDCISHTTNTLGKGMNPKYSPSSYGEIVGQTRFFSLGEATSLGEPVKLRLKTDLVSYPARAEGLVNMIIHKNTNYYSNTYIIFITHVLSKITIVHIKFTQHFINLL